MERISLSLMGFLLLSISFLPFAGCSDEGPEGSDVTSPEVGSSYTYTEHETENGTKIDSTEQTTTTTLVETDLSFSGKTDVLRFKEVSDAGDTSSVWLKYESNNDVSLYLDLESEMSGDPNDSLASVIKPVWITLPFGSKDSQTITLIDTTYANDMGGTDTMKLSLTTSWVREETATISGTSLKIWIAKATINGSFSIPLVGQLPIQAESMIYFAPEIGYFYKQEISTTVLFQVAGSVTVLTSYTLK